jgi:hypothetical protein
LPAVSGVGPVYSIALETELREELFTSNKYEVLQRPQQRVVISEKKFSEANLVPGASPCAPLGHNVLILNLCSYTLILRAWRLIVNNQWGKI